MAKIENFRDLEVWQRAHKLVLAVYQETRHFPVDERFCLVPQMRRAAVSVAANIAEGFKRKNKAEKIRFYNISEASLEELKYFFILCHDLNYITGTECHISEADVVSKMLYRLCQSIRGDNS